MENPKTTQTIPQEIFTLAALQHLKCNPADIEIRILDENKEAYLDYQGQGFKISTRASFREQID